MSEQTPNAGEKCPVCDGEKVIILEQLCFRCQGTGLKPAMESPAEFVKERDAYAKMFAEHTKEIADLTTKLAALQVEKEADMRSFNEAAKFSVDMIAKQGETITTLRATLKNGADTTYTIDIAPKDGTPIIGIYDDGEEFEIEWSEQRQCMLAGVGGGNGYFGCGWQDTYNKLIVDTPLCWKPSPNAVRHSVSELAVLKRENDRLNVINNGMVDNLKMWQSANAVFDKELTTLRAENQGLEAIIKSKQTSITDLASHVRSQVKEVERLREAQAESMAVIKSAMNLLGDMGHNYGNGGTFDQVCDMLDKLREALKPTPDGE